MTDIRIREHAFGWLRERVAIHGEVLPRSELEVGFVLDSEQIRLVGPSGIFKPKVMQLPVSITTVASGPYDDEFSQDGLLRYRYRGTDPQHRDNVGLREAMRGAVPLVYFHGIAPGKYLAAWPVFIVGDDPYGLTFSVAVDEAEGAGGHLVGQVADGAAGSRNDDAWRAYATRKFRQRLHQQGFRERVLRAYREQCAFCRLRHQELLDAAHIIPDGEPGGKPIVPNGLALCKLHHAAFDRQFVGIREDYVLEVREDLLKEHDGPMLRHGLQELHGTKIILPRSAIHRPDPELLKVRYERFRAA
jgi:putative restriction endonuclease